MALIQPQVIWDALSYENKGNNLHAFTHDLYIKDEQRLLPA